MLYGVCFHVIQMICKCVLMWMTPAEDSGGREWECENVEWCVQWFPVALMVCEVFQKHVKWKEFSNKVHLNRWLVDIAGVSFVK